MSSLGRFQSDCNTLCNDLSIYLSSSKHLFNYFVSVRSQIIEGGQFERAKQRVDKDRQREIDRWIEII